MRLSISSCQTKDALSKDPVYLQGLNTRQMCEHLEICLGIPNYQEADAPVEETFRHLSKINLIEQVKDVVDRAYIVSCWSLYCQKKGFEQMYVSQGATTKKAAMKMHDSIRSHILQSFNLEDQQNKDELVQISVRMNARASTKDKFSPDHYRVKNVFAECQPAYVYWDNACKRGAKVDQVVQLLGTAVLEMSELPWSLLYNSSAKDLEQILFYLQKNVKLDQKTTVCNSNGLLSEETSEPSVGIQEIADASQVTASFTSQKLDIKVQPPPVQSTSKVIMSDLPTVAEIASKGKQSNEGALIENALGSRTSGSRRK
ncbi:hypothetical protein MIR68_005757 [Amoeboaphelidium protococcarum]|nr:hypothetical protein MIR68_005757 [Amoeboaphelidium protococcarum]